MGYWDVLGDIYQRMFKLGWLRIVLMPDESKMLMDGDRISGEQWDWITQRAINNKLKVVDDDNDVVVDYSVGEGQAITAGTALAEVISETV